MEGNISNIRFVGIQLPLWSYYANIHPLDVKGHYGVIIKAVLEKFNWNYEGEALMSKGEVNGDGVLGSLAKNESDISFCSTVPEYEAFRYVDYSHVMYEPKIFVVSCEASVAFESSAFAFLRIYTSSVWFTWLVFLFITALFWNLAENILSRRSRSHGAFCSNKGLTGKLFDTCRILLYQDVNLASYPFGLRLGLCCWIIACFVLGAAFVGGLLSKLTLPPQPAYVNTLRDILKHPRLRVQVFQDSTIGRILKASNNAVARMVWERIIQFDSEIYLFDWEPDETKEKMSRGQIITFLEEQEILELWPIIFERDFLSSIHISPRIDLTIQNAFPLRKGLDPAKARIVRGTVQSLFEGHIIWQSFQLAFWKNNVFFDKYSTPPKKLGYVLDRVFRFRIQSSNEHLNPRLSTAKTFLVSLEFLCQSLQCDILLTNHSTRPIYKLNSKIFT